MTTSGVCQHCGSAVDASARFCANCGTALEALCPACGSPVSGRFCSQCGTPLSAAEAGAAAAPPPPAPVSERRVTSVLFADLVGFTPLSESRDSEDIRELLSRYFDMARLVINRYGGVVEKFIGDAVMAVWGVPATQEDDAERAVRAGLDLLDAIAGLRDETGIPQLAMRVGIVTGEVAVTIGATGQGMVAGDAVNTAARVQSAARPGQVWVDETTRGLTVAAVAYADEGDHSLKGKAEPLRLFSAQRVIASVGGAQRVDGLEAPFIGRDREMRLVKELFHAVLEEKRPRLVAVSGQPGVGKSRLGWEFFKHLDGINDLVRWHRGRCLAYGEGVAFWALAEMVRSRLDVLEGDEPTVVADKLEAGLQRWVGDDDERAWIYPRLAALLGIGSGGFSQQDLFPAWQLFFERLITPEAAGVVLLVEDLQWADDGLLDFLEHLLRRSTAPLFIVTFARPELAERRPAWATDRRAMPIHLEPLADPAMGELIDGLVGDLPPDARQVLVERSEGTPLYAVETVRSLIDRDAVVPQDGRYVLAPGASLDLGRSAPTSLQTLIAARLDLLAPEERRTVQDAAVLGLAFPRAALVALRSRTGDERAAVDEVLESLLSKEILTLENDPRSPERGQFRFVQSMVRTVAYDTLSRRDRKLRHLIAAEQLLADADAEAFAAVVAAHFIDARNAEPGDADAAELAQRAVAQLEIAAERARRLGSPGQALRHYEQALELAEDAVLRLRLTVAGAGSAVTAGHFDAALQLADDAAAAARQLGRTIDLGRASIHAGSALLALGRGSEVKDRLVPVYESLEADPDGAVDTLAVLARLIGRSLWITASDAAASEMWFDRCVRLAESAELWSELADCFGSYGGLMITTGRPTMGLGLLQIALTVATEHNLGAAQLNVRNNLASFLATRRPHDAREHVEAGLALARRLGEREFEMWLYGTAAHVYWISGAWESFESISVTDVDKATGVTQFYGDALALRRGLLQAEPITIREDADPQWRAARIGRQGLAAWAAGDVATAATLLGQGADILHQLVEFDDDFPTFWSLALEAACDAGADTAARERLELITAAPKGKLPVALRALVPYFKARLATAADAVSVEADYVEASGALRDFGAPMWLGLSLLRHAQWLISQGRGDAATPHLDEAEQIFGSLRAAPDVERARQARAYAVR